SRLTPTPETPAECPTVTPPTIMPQRDFRIRTHGEPVNAEPQKCARIAWFPLDEIPDSTYPYTRVGIDLHRRRENFAISGWET
ncbi:hypothetical protein ALLO2DRAFT_03900, partial [Frankia sp. Allo2]